MPARTAERPAAPAETPLATFSDCHRGILTQLEAFAQLPELAAAARRAQQVATATLALFEPSVLEHHRDEERELFPAVERSATPGAEADWVKAMAQRLTREHRAIEVLWRGVRPDVRLAAAGKGAIFRAASVAELVRLYTAHAQFEEDQFLPLAQEILGRNGNHMAALGVSLHMRHAPQPVGYI